MRLSVWTVIAALCLLSGTRVLAQRPSFEAGFTPSHSHKCIGCSRCDHGSCLDCLPRSNVDLPLLKELAEGSGVTLPLPFGISFISTELDRTVAVRDLRVGIGGAPPQSVERFSVGELDAHASTQIGRLDCWLLPCLNLYGVLGHTHTRGEITATVEQFPLPTSPSFSIPINIDLHGPTYGGGGTLAVGTKEYFATLDVNYTKTDFTRLDSELFALVITPRIGAIIDHACFKGEIHIGAMYQDAEQTVEVLLDQPILGPIKVSVDQFEPEQWNFLVGGLWAIDERLQLMVEGGMGGRSYVISGATIRF